MNFLKKAAVQSIGDGIVGMCAVTNTQPSVDINVLVLTMPVPKISLLIAMALR